MNQYVPVVQFSKHKLEPVGAPRHEIISLKWDMDGFLTVTVHLVVYALTWNGSRIQQGKVDRVQSHHESEWLIFFFLVEDSVWDF